MSSLRMGTRTQAEACGYTRRDTPKQRGASCPARVGQAYHRQREFEA